MTTLVTFIPQGSGAATALYSPKAAPAQRITAVTPSPWNQSHDVRWRDARDDGSRLTVIAAALARARAAGIAAVWTGPCTASVDLARLAGPEHYAFDSAGAAFFGLPGTEPWQLFDLRVRVAVYERVLTSGTQFDIYRWVNLIDLATAWTALRLPRGVRGEWQGVLQAAALLQPQHRYGGEVWGQRESGAR